MLAKIQLCSSQFYRPIAAGISIVLYISRALVFPWHLLAMVHPIFLQNKIKTTTQGVTILSKQIKCVACDWLTALLFRFHTFEIYINKLQPPRTWVLNLIPVIIKLTSSLKKTNGSRICRNIKSQTSFPNVSSEHSVQIVYILLFQTGASKKPHTRTAYTHNYSSRPIKMTNDAILFANKKWKEFGKRFNFMVIRTTTTMITITITKGESVINVRFHQISTSSLLTFGKFNEIAFWWF